MWQFCEVSSPFPQENQTHKVLVDTRRILRSLLKAGQLTFALIGDGQSVRQGYLLRDRSIVEHLVRSTPNCCWRVRWTQMPRMLAEAVETIHQERILTSRDADASRPPACASMTH